MPIFWLGLILLYVFFYKYGWLPGPVGRTGSATSDFDEITGFLTIDTLIQGDFADFWEAVKALVLPCVTLGFVAMAPIARFTRASMVEVLESDYVRTARSLGLPYGVVVRRNALKNAAIGILTIVAAVYGYALGGEVLVEIIFNWPGLGLYSYNAILSSDFPAIQGFVLVVTLFYMIIYLLLDLATAVLDPRVKF
jgi:peptide/nickel transport system permease protein